MFGQPINHPATGCNFRNWTWAVRWVTWTYCHWLRGRWLHPDHHPLRFVSFTWQRTTQIVNLPKNRSQIINLPKNQTCCKVSICQRTVPKLSICQRTKHVAKYQFAKEPFPNYQSAKELNIYIASPSLVTNMGKRASVHFGTIPCRYFRPFLDMGKSDKNLGTSRRKHLQTTRFPLKGVLRVKGILGCLRQKGPQNEAPFTRRIPLLNSFFSQVERCFDLFCRVWWGMLKMKHGEGFGLPMLPKDAVWEGSKWSMGRGLGCL